MKTDTRCVRRILKKPNYFGYKRHAVQEHNDDDYLERIKLCETFREKIDSHPNFLNFVVFSDEATFYLHGAVNKHNQRYWCDENLHWMVEEDTQTQQKVNVWCGIVGTNVKGPFFINGNLTGPFYLEILQTEIVPAITRLFPGELFNSAHFQQDGAPAHYSAIVRQYLSATFPERWIGRGTNWNGAIPWPARSLDLTPLDFFS